MNRTGALLAMAAAITPAAIGAAQAKAPIVTPREARAAAIYAVHGAPISTHYVRRGGAMQYVVKVRHDGSVEDIVVSPVTGQVIGHRPAGSGHRSHRGHHRRHR